MALASKTDFFKHYFKPGIPFGFEHWCSWCNVDQSQQYMYMYTSTRTCKQLVLISMSRSHQHLHGLLQCFNHTYQYAVMQSTLTIATLTIASAVNCQEACPVALRLAIPILNHSVANCARHKQGAAYLKVVYS